MIASTQHLKKKIEEINIVEQPFRDCMVVETGCSTVHTIWHKDLGTRCSAEVHLLCASPGSPGPLQSCSPRLFNCAGTKASASLYLSHSDFVPQNNYQRHGKFYRMFISFIGLWKRSGLTVSTKIPAVPPTILLQSSSL